MKTVFRDLWLETVTPILGRRYYFNILRRY